MKLGLSELAHNKVCEAILISGSARSGTTILGKMLYSFKGVEYAFEPPMLFSLLPLIKILGKDEWKLLYESYLYEDFFIDSIAGRRINCNLADDSSVFNAKSELDVAERLSKSVRKTDLEQNGISRNIAFKMPDITPYIADLQRYYPKTKFVIMKRDAVGTINSLLEKKWFSNERSQMNMVWPFRVHRNFHIPFWVRKEEDEDWVNMSEVDRCAYYYIRVYEGLEKVGGKIEISYNTLLSSPLDVANNFAEELGLEFGEKTLEIVGQIKPTIKKRDPSILHKISKKYREKVICFSDAS
ncbi:MAG: sulfotransferase [Gammaproteobacteria bacterium]|nr:sulfotransferase [Gammaproteobacteria bacterium]